MTDGRETANTRRPNDPLIGGNHRTHRTHRVMPVEAGIHDFLPAPSKVVDARHDASAAPVRQLF
jgi:hypothetical protein